MILLELGARRRATLSKIGRHDRYMAEELEDGAVVLHPAVVMSEVQTRLLANPELLRQLTLANAPDAPATRRPLPARRQRLSD